ncbi:MAG: toprim domain-containing protein [Planctomycetota bacterium]
MSRSEWIRVSKSKPCKICSRSDWCAVSANDKIAHCMRTESSKPCKSGGWIHNLDDSQLISTVPKRMPKPIVRSEPSKDFFSLARQYQHNLTDLTVLSKDLGISIESLKRLEVGWDGRNYTFPMRNGNDRIVGIRLRRNGSKYCVTGSKTALFWPDGVVVDSKQPLWICEGESDCAALLDLGFDAIGRPSCNSGTHDIKTILARYNRDVIIMADKDKAVTRPDGPVYYPGIEGALRLAEAIKSIVRSVKCVLPAVGTDIREWVQNGATREAVLAAANNARTL